jgi:guanylate kinase
MYYHIVAIIGPSASGKDTMLHRILNSAPDFNEIAEYTTRPKRDNKDNAYMFLSNAEMANKVASGEVFSQVIFNNSWVYAFDKLSLNKDKINIGVFSPAQITRLFKENNLNFGLYLLYMDASDKTRLMRSLQRESNPDCAEICRRFLADKEDFNNKSFWNLYGPHHINTDQIITAGEIDVLIDKIREWAETDN